jgi:transcriptional regulator with XRE-family HTH domain
MLTKFRHLRQLKGVTLKQFSREIGCPYTSMSRVEQGKAFCTQDMAEKIPRALGVQFEEIFGEDWYALPCS